MNKNTTYTILAFSILITLGLLFVGIYKNKSVAVTTYNECVLAGYPILETYPEQCKTPDGKTFVRPITPPVNSGTTNKDIGDDLVLDNITYNQIVTSPLVITGKARNLYFEGSFPIKLLDSKGNILAQVPAQAQGEWMTNEFVPFKANITFKAPVQGGAGTLIFQNDNPSGIPENLRELIIPVRFASTVSSVAKFDTNISMEIGNKITFPDTLVVELENIEDSLCKPDVQCIWAGELSPVLRVGKARSIVRLGTSTKTSVTFGNYTFTLNSATETVANISVKKNN